MKTTISGTEIKRLMKQHKVTILTLAFRMQISQKRVRMVRDGHLFITHAGRARDWIEAITGRDPVTGERSSDVMTRVIFDM